MASRYILSLFFCLCAMTSVRAQEPWEFDNRIPESTLPVHYDLYLYPDLVTQLFSGNVVIEINSTQPRDYFLIHSKNLNIQNTLLEQKDDTDTWQAVELLDVFAYTPNEFWVIRTSAQVTSGTFRISCDFDGSLKDNGLVGFYYSVYTDANNQSQSLATTKFEPTYARMAFPCIDEPSFKSTYSVVVVRPSNPDYIVLSNMPVAAETPDKPTFGLTEVTFETSVPMVTYLVCFIVCDFVYIEEILDTGLPFRVYAPSGKIDSTQYALQIGGEILGYYTDMFDYPFPLPKMDMAAIPDYVSGATEHWGIITYRETSIYYNPDTSSATNQQRVASVVAHELAHQWFGNLVTLKWWDDLWLNEGFASYIEYKGVTFVQSDWDMASQFVTESLQSVFNLDSKLSSHPIQHSVTTPDEITAMFDSISYDKGSSVLRMLEGFVGTPVFQAGVNSFIKKYAYQNAVTAQLWAELTTAWNEAGVDSDVGVIMGTWTEQMGYPVLDVVTSTSSTGGTSVTITQKRFLQDPAAVSDPSESPHEYKWHIPIGYTTSDAPEEMKMVWLYKEDASVTIELESSVTWFKINDKQTGYFRVNYETPVWTSMAELCTNKLISPEDRSSLYDDAFCLADASQLPYSTPLDLSLTLKTETHLVPWESSVNRLEKIIYLLLESSIYSQFREFVTSLVSDTYNSLGWQDEGAHIDRLLRVQIVYLSCFSGVSECLQESASLLQSYAADNTFALPLDTTRQVFRQGMVQGGTTEVWNSLWALASGTQDATLKDNLLYGLANSQDVDTLSSYITMSQDANVVRTQDFLNVLTYISLNPAGTDLVWSWTRDNWEWLVDRYTLNDRYLGELIPDITQYFATQERLNEMEAFFAEYPDAGAGEQYREQALETVKINIAWLESNEPQIEAWLSARK